MHKTVFTTAATPKHNCIVHFSRFGTIKAKSLIKVQFDAIIFVMKGNAHSLNIVKGYAEGIPLFLSRRFYNKRALQRVQTHLKTHLYPENTSHVDFTIIFFK